mmetsp:Transcript_6610/g.9264  ORF Transcript_6610/g.9264 Transcript_6610/m.9264 type:complete len:447 (-) Transcript_6610:112-1452(-)
MEEGAWNFEDIRVLLDEKIQCIKEIVPKVAQAAGNTPPWDTSALEKTATIMNLDWEVVRSSALKIELDETTGLPKVQAQMSTGQIHSLLSLSIFVGLPYHLQRLVSHARFYDYMCNEVGLARLACLLTYLKEPPPMVDSQFLTISRRRTLDDVSDLISSNQKLCSVTLKENKIEDSTASHHVDFANARLHIGRIIPSATQEEILFSIKPELFAAMLLESHEPMRDNEAIIISGARCFSTYSGYLNSFRFTGPVTKIESRPPSIIAIDAVVVSSYNEQFAKSSLERDLLKAYLGFRDADSVSTGGWGTGAFGGDPILKFLQQWVAASLANVNNLDYSCYANPSLFKRLTKIHAALQHLYVHELWQLILDFSLSSSMSKMQIKGAVAPYLSGDMNDMAKRATTTPETPFEYYLYSTSYFVGLIFSLPSQDDDNKKTAVSNNLPSCELA